MASKIAMSLPVKIESVIHEIALLKEKIAMKQAAIEEMGDHIALGVHQALDENGKKLYGNEELRGIAIRMEQRNNAVWRETRDARDDLVYEKERLVGRLERLRGEFQLEIIERLQVEVNPDPTISGLIPGPAVAG